MVRLTVRDRSEEKLKNIREVGERVVMAEEKLETLPELVKHHPTTYQVLARLQLSVKTLSKRQTNPKTTFPFDRMSKIVC